MSRRLRQALIAVMLVLYGSVSLCDRGLHRLNEIVGSRMAAHEHMCTHVHDSKSEPLDQDDPGHCSLCQFHAQGQLTTEPIRIVSRPFTSPHVPLILAEVATRDRHPSSSPRAPPILAASCRAAV